jgi:hypothetical protein
LQKSQLGVAPKFLGKLTYPENAFRCTIHE